MSATLKLDRSGNIQSGSSFMVISGNDALAQDIKNMLSMWRGEYPFNVEEGIDYKTFFQTQDKNRLLSEISEKVRSDERVATVKLDVSDNGKNLLITVQTVNGEMVTVGME